MSLTRYLIVILAMSMYVEAELSYYEKMLCLVNSSSDDPDTCLLGGRFTNCSTFKCFRTVGKSCLKDKHDAHLTGQECAKSLFCSCDDKCNGCMEVNGEQICHRANCMANLGKRNQMKALPFDTRDKSMEYPIDN